MSRKLLTTLVIGALGAVAVALILNLLIAVGTPDGTGERAWVWGPFDLATVSREVVDTRTSSVTLQIGWTYWALIVSPLVLVGLAVRAADHGDGPSQ